MMTSETFSMREAISVLMVGFLLLTGTQTSHAEPKPNIIYTLADDLGYGDQVGRFEKLMTTARFESDLFPLVSKKP